MQSIRCKECKWSCVADPNESQYPFKCRKREIVMTIYGWGEYIRDCDKYEPRIIEKVEDIKQ